MVRFQCSSASRKFLKVLYKFVTFPFSPFQCSSASRKFLKRTREVLRLSRPPGFSALQRAENSSRLSVEAATSNPFTRFSALQRAENSSRTISADAARSSCGFSALQRAENSSRWCFVATSLRCLSFSALQRAENSSRFDFLDLLYGDAPFQCSSASRKFLKPDTSRA